MHVDWLQLGIQCLKNDERKKAIAYLLKATKEDPLDARPWIWLSQAVGHNEQRVQCLRKALKINPANAEAQRLFAQAQWNAQGGSQQPSAWDDLLGISSTQDDDALPPEFAGAGGQESGLIGLYQEKSTPPISPEMKDLAWLAEMDLTQGIHPEAVVDKLVTYGASREEAQRIVKQIPSTLSPATVPARTTAAGSGFMGSVLQRVQGLMRHFGLN